MDYREILCHLVALLCAIFFATSGDARAQSVTRVYSCSLGGSPWAGTSTDSFQDACSVAAASSPLVDGPSCTPSSQSVSGTYNGQCALFTTVDTTCSNGANRPSGSGAGVLNCSVSYGCSGGYVFTNGACLPPAGTTQDDCGRTKGNRPSGDLCAVLPPSGYTMQHNGCVYEMGGTGELYTLTEGPQAGQTMWCGGWIGTGQAVGSTSPNVGVTRPGGGSSPGTTNTTDPNRTGQTGGGTSQSGQGFNSTDAANLSRIATNTGTTIRAVDNMSQNLGAKLDALRSAPGGSTGGGGSTPGGTSWQGEEGKPLADGTAAVEGAIGSAADEMAKSQDDLSDALKTPPNFGGNQSRWVFGFGAFFPSSSKCSHTWDLNFPSIGVQHFTLDVCSWGEYFRSFMFWALGIFTAWALWSTVYNTARKA